jgi:hypothetical protein
MRFHCFAGWDLFLLVVATDIDYPTSTESFAWTVAEDPIVILYIWWCLRLCPSHRYHMDASIHILT